MPKKKDIVKCAPIRENSRLMHTHEAMVDYINGRTSSSIMEMFGPAMFGLNYFANLEEDLIFSDEEEEDDDDDDNNVVPYSSQGANRSLEPHPQIKQLTDEEADKIAKELIEEEKRNKEKTERNKRKKKRKKEKKRLEKENALKEIISEEEQGKSDSLANQGQTAVTDNTLEANESSQAIEPPVTAEAEKCDMKSFTEEKSLVKVNEDDQQKEPTKEEINDKCEVAEVQPREEEKPDVAVKPELHKKIEQETSKEKTSNPITEEFAKRSIDLANMGNRLAAAGQFETAVNCFTDAIKFNPREFKLFGNRSLCYERLQQYKSALRDADVALSMEPKWIKGLFRKGKALCGLKRYYEASLIYKEVLTLESKSAEAAQELKRAQTLHLMEMGFTWAQSSEALKTHATLEEAVEALFAADASPDAGASWDKSEQPVEQEDGDDDDDDEEGDWVITQTSRPQKLHPKESDAPDQNRSTPQWLPHPKSFPRPELFSVWVRTLAPNITYQKLQEVFSRPGRVYSIKMLLDYGCAYVNYTRKEDCDRAIELIDGMVVDGAPLSVQHPSKIPPKPPASMLATSDNSRRPGPHKRECFFWRTSGCTRDDCTFRHVPEHKNIDRDKFTGRLGYQSYAGNHK
ncbi:tetratricopeptide repeat protein 31-like isoform X2 [Cololabis saira]|uniref:tetratricopeptide repeat protein 31-like isoform X2 n=1 Tax=Cololabis saira TaxID=129043 RepID=UPI002AD3353A|nr:tetratricopeptide repeat protein 31-like isoform X2 [Cololabis saira]